jgi:hypothetical protein
MAFLECVITGLAAETVKLFFKGHEDLIDFLGSFP